MESKNDTPILKVYRVAIDPICSGVYDEHFYSDREEAKKAFDALIKKLRGDKNTVDNDDCGYYNYNLMPQTPSRKDTISVKNLSTFNHEFWYLTGGEIPEYDTNLQYIILDEITINEKQEESTK